MVMLTPFAYGKSQNTQFTGQEKAITSLASTTDIVTESPAVSVEFMPTEKVRMGKIKSIDDKNNSFVIQIGNRSLYVENTATTSFYLGGGESSSLNEMAIDMKVYVFGYIKSDDSAMLATKVVIANKIIYPQRKVR